MIRKVMTNVRRPHSAQMRANMSVAIPAGWADFVGGVFVGELIKVLCGRPVDWAMQITESVF